MQYQGWKIRNFSGGECPHAAHADPLLHTTPHQTFCHQQPSVISRAHSVYNAAPFCRCFHPSHARILKKGPVLNSQNLRTKIICQYENYLVTLQYYIIRLIVTMSQTSRHGGQVLHYIVIVMHSCLWPCMGRLTPNRMCIKLFSSCLRV